MSLHTFSFAQKRHRSRRNSQRGVALVTTLLLLLLLTGISITMVLSVSSDVLVDGYYRNFRGSFYSADSGINIARAAIVNDMQTKVVPGWGSTLAPFPTGTDGIVATDIYTTYKTTTSLNGGSATYSWPGKFQLASATVALSPAGCQVQNGTGTCAAPVWNKGAASTGYKYIYNYSLTSIGQAKGTEAATVTESGSITMNATIAPGVPAIVNFAAYGMFIDQYPLCGNDLVAGTITGPVFTNGSWNFGTGGYTFTDAVQSAGAQAGYDNGGCVPSAAASANGISPNFQKGFQPSQNKITPPANSFNQEQAVLDGVGLSATQPNKVALNAALKDASGKAYPVGGAAGGVFLPYVVDPKTGVASFNGGGVLVEGNATVTLSVPNPASNTTAQIYTIVNNGQTTTLTVDPAANGGVGSTVITTTGVGTQTISGVPTMKDATGNTEGPATMLYVDGDITALSGPGEGKTAIQNASALTITSSGDVTLTGDIKYAAEPVTFAKNQIPGTDVDTLIPANDTRQVLGIFTASGNVNLNNLQSDGNLEIDASIATISAGGSGGIVNKGGNTGGTLNIVGGRIQNTIQNIGFSKRNVFFDRRFLAGGFAPPWFPSAQVTPPVGAVSLSVTPTIQRTQWLNKTAYQ